MSEGTDPAPDSKAPAAAPTTIEVSVSTGAVEAPDDAEAALTVTSTPAFGDASPKSSTTTSPDGDTGVIVTTTLASAPAESAASTATPLLRLTFAAPGSTVTLAADGTGAIVSPAGDLVAGFTAPVVVDTSGTTLPATWQGLDTDPTDPADPADLVVVDLVTDPRAAAYPLTVTVHLGTSVVAGTEWGDREGGESLAVTPSAWGRVSGQTGSAFGWADVVRREPGADTAVMEKQFRCHQLGALDKATWNLEPWRPDVSSLDYLIARCNPT